MVFGRKMREEERREEREQDKEEERREKEAHELGENIKNIIPNQLATSVI